MTIRIIPAKPEYAEAARVANRLLDDYFSDPSRRKALEDECAAEVARQLISNLPPSEGVPDCRVRRPWVEDYQPKTTRPEQV